MSPTSYPDVDEDRHGGKQESGGDEVILGRSGLANDERVALEDDGCGHHGEMASPVRPADAPRSQEAQSEETEVQKQGQGVPMCEQDAGCVEQLRVLRVEP